MSLFQEPAPRVPQITEAERTGEVHKMFAAMEGLSPSNIAQNPVLLTFAHYPALTQPFLVFNRHLLSTSKLPVRLRQIAILRVAWTRRAPYMWASHLRLSLRLGLTAADFDAVKSGADCAHWSELERTTLHAVDQLCARSDMDDSTWNALTPQLDRQQMMDLLFTVGTYILLGLTFNAMRIEREPELQELAQRYGSPAAPF